MTTVYCRGRTRLEASGPVEGQEETAECQIATKRTKRAPQGSEQVDKQSTILVVDDDLRNVSLMEFLLESWGHKTVKALSGPEALDKLTPDIDLVLLDVMMKGMDGFQVAGKIRADPEFGDIPIIMVTVLSSKEDRLEAVKAGANDFITKPVDRVELGVRIDSLLKMKRAGDALKRYRQGLEATVDKKTAELGRSEERYRMLVENAPLGVVTCDPEGNIIDVNPRMLAILGSASEKDTRAINVVTFPALIEAGISGDVRRCMETGALVVSERSYTSRWGKHVCMRAHLVPTRDRDNRVTGVQAIVEDITQAMAAQQALRESEQRFRAVFETAQDCVFIKDDNLRYTHVNPATLALMEASLETVLGRTDEELLGFEQSRSLKNVDLRVLQGQVIESEHSVSLRGRIVAFNAVKVPLKDTAGRTIGLCGIARDITEFRERTKDSTERSGRVRSSVMQSVINRARLAANTDSIILLLGESGSGKDHLARYIHDCSQRSGGPFFTINCAALPPELAESELFGHEAGAFSGARGRKRGLLELAEGGTLLLNEIGELSPPLQAKLLTFLDTQSFTRVGGEKSITVSARLLAATNRDLGKEATEGRFRSDLYYRINVFAITVPPLRERPEDIPVLVEDLLGELSAKLGLTDPPVVEPACHSILTGYAWPGNIRELRNMLERALILTGGKRITPGAIGLSPSNPKGPPEDRNPLLMCLAPHRNLNEALEQVKRNLIQEALRQSGGKKLRAAEILGISRDALKHHIKSLGL